MAEDIAHFLATQLRRARRRTGPITLAELEDLCRERGIEVRWLDELPGVGCSALGVPLILLDESAGPEDLKHETFHALHQDAVEHDLDYGPPAWEQYDHETAADRFSEVLEAEE